MFLCNELILAVALKKSFGGNELGDLVKIVLGQKMSFIVRAFIIFVSISTFIAAILLTSLLKSTVP